MKKLFLLTLIFTFFLFGLAISVNTSFGRDNNNNNNEEEKVWCHKFDDDECEEKQKEECNGAWDEGRCPTNGEDERVCFCHNVNNNPHTICTDEQGEINGHTTHVNNGSDTQGECSAVVDQCSNIEGVQETIPANYYKSDGACYPKTPVCANDSYDNYGGEDGVFNQETEVADNELCSNEQDCPANSTPNSDKVCTCDAGFHQVTPELDVVFACESDVTPTPTTDPCANGGCQTPPGGPGDGRSDGRSDGKSSSSQPAVLGASTAKQGEVLGASTFAKTGAFDSTVATIEQAIGFVLTAAGGAIAYGKKRASKKSK